MSEYPDVKELVAFIYPSLAYSGSMDDKLSPPDIAIFGASKTELQTIIITAGILNDGRDRYIVGIDVSFNGESAVKGESGNEVENCFFSSPSPGQFASISKFYVKGVDLSHSGTYTVNFYLYEKRDGLPADGALIDSSKCYFVVSPK